MRVYYVVFERIVVECMDYFFFFQAEDGIRDLTVTGVQTCALPILFRSGDERYVRSLLPRRSRCGCPEWRVQPEPALLSSRDVRVHWDARQVGRPSQDRKSVV